MKSTRYAVGTARGFTMVELMIALTLGLVLVAAIGSIYISNSKSYRTAGSVSQVQEKGRFAELLVTPVVRLAGYLPAPLTQPDPSQIFSAGNNKLAIFGVDNADRTAPTTANFPGFDPTQIVANTDVLVIAFQGKSADNSATVTNVDRPLQTCLGRDVDSATVAVNIFFIRNDETGVPNLYCYDNLTAAGLATSDATASASVQPLVQGVTNMQILYGIDNGNDFSVNQYLDAAHVTDWTRVASVQINFTVNSTDVTEGARANSDIVGGKITHAFSTVIQIRNRLGA